MVIFEVGQPYPPVAGKPEGVYFEIDEAGAKLIYNFTSPSAREIASAQEGSPFEFSKFSKSFYRGLTRLLQLAAGSMSVVTV